MPCGCFPGVGLALTTSTPDIGLLWAKTDRDNLAAWHPLINHLIEVSAVARELWEKTTPPTIKNRWTSHFGIDVNLAGAWLAILAGVHDLGKASPVFQGASPEQRLRLAGADLAF